MFPEISFWIHCWRSHKSALIPNWLLDFIWQQVWIEVFGITRARVCGWKDLKQLGIRVYNRARDMVSLEVKRRGKTQGLVCCSWAPESGIWVSLVEWFLFCFWYGSERRIGAKSARILWIASHKLHWKFDSSEILAKCILP
jgi:hypothetical protein